MVIMGTSGSGKSTLLHILSALDKLDAGKFKLNGEVNKRNKGLLTFLCIVLFVASATSAFASSYWVEDNKLYYEGYQTDDTVYSHIWDTNLSDSYDYMVKASVKVCSSITTSGFVPDEAEAEDDRSFWCNESSYYDYYSLD